MQRKSITEVKRIINERAINTMLQKLHLGEVGMVKAVYFGDKEDYTPVMLRFTRASATGKLNSGTRLMFRKMHEQYFSDFGFVNHCHNRIEIFSRVKDLNAKKVKNKSKLKLSGFVWQVEKINLNELVLVK